MTKKKYDLKKYADMCKEIKVHGADGTEVTVRSHIPYSEKMEMAQEWAGQTIMTHDESCVYISHEKDLYRIYMIAKYYTDIDTEDATPEEVADFMINNGIYVQAEDHIFDDMVVCDEIYDAIYRMYDKTYTDDKSLTKAIRTSFGFLFNGEDLTESMAKAEATKDVIYDAFSKIQAKEKEESERIDGGKLKINGNIIQFGKRE